MNSFADVNNAPFLKTLKRWQRCAQPLCCLLILILFIHYVLYHALRPQDNVMSQKSSTPNYHHHNHASVLSTTSGSRLATPLSPSDLMSRPVSSSLTHVPNLFHQSWADGNLPIKFSEWSKSCRNMNPDWEYVLWTDEDNHALVKKYAPWFLEIYEGLKSEIYRADTVRNLYMHLFGGVYADLDTECLRPWNELFAEQGISTLDDHRATRTTLSPLNVSTTQTVGSHGKKAFLGRLGTDPKKKYSLPNAWMASCPSHPFWLLPLELVESGEMPYGDMPEAVTGPDALYHLASGFLRKGGRKLEKHFANTDWADMYGTNAQSGDAGNRSMVGSIGGEGGDNELILLPHEQIYPFWWGQKDFEIVCLASSDGFDPETCKDVLDVEGKGSWSITYWSHTWDAQKGHDKGHLESIGKAIKAPWRSSVKDEPDEREKGGGKRRRRGVNE